jgi:hypothetical protein
VRDSRWNIRSKRDDLGKMICNTDFVLGRVKKDSVGNVSQTKVSRSVYHNDFHSRNSSLIQENLGPGVAAVRNLQERRLNCPSLYKKSTYDTQYVKPAGSNLQLKNRPKNNILFENNLMDDSSTYQSMYRAPKKIIDELSKPIHPSP